MKHKRSATQQGPIDMEDKKYRRKKIEGKDSEKEKKPID